MLSRTDPERLEHVFEALDAIGGRCLGERCQGQRRHGLDLLLLVFEPLLYAVDETFQMREDGATHHDGDLLDDADARVARLPAFLGAAHCLEEGQQGRDAESRSDDGKGACGGVADVLVDVVDVWAHGADHVGQTGGFGKVADDLAAFDACVVVLVDEKGLDDDEDAADVRTDQIVELVEDAIDDLDEQVAFLILQCPFHEQWQDLVEERARSEIAGTVGDLTQRSLSRGRGSVFDLEQEAHDLTLLLLLAAEIGFVLVGEDLFEEGLIFRLEKG